MTEYIISIEVLYMNFVRHNERRKENKNLFSVLRVFTYIFMAQREK